MNLRLFLLFFISVSAYGMDFNKKTSPSKKGTMLTKKIDKETKNLEAWRGMLVNGWYVTPPLQLQPMVGPNDSCISARCRHG